MATATLRPNGAGALTQNSPAGDTPNWKCVDEAVQDGDATYVYSPFGQYYRYDLYELEDLPAAVPISKVTICAYIRSGAPPQFALYASLIIRTHDTNYGMGSVWPPENYVLYTWVHTTNPFTGLAWTKEEVDALQVGPALYYDNWPTTSTRCTQVYVEVDYTPPAVGGLNPALVELLTGV